MKNLLTTVTLIFALMFGVTQPNLAMIPQGPEADMIRSIPAYSSRSFRATFEGDEMAEAAVIGDGGTYLSVYITDKNGREVKRSERKTVHYLRWYAATTQQYTIKIVNHGDVYNDCRILTN